MTSGTALCCVSNWVGISRITNVMRYLLTIRFLLVFTAVLILPSVAFAQTVIGNFTNGGTTNSITVPAGVFRVTIDAKGADGGNTAGSSNDAGEGASTAAVFDVVPGDVIHAIVGEAGETGDFEAGGGGGTGVFINNTLVIVLGGGGGSDNTGDGLGGNNTTSGTSHSGAGAPGTGGQGGQAGATSNPTAGGAGGGGILSAGGNTNTDGGALTQGGAQADTNPAGGFTVSAGGTSNQTFDSAGGDGLPSAGGAGFGGGGAGSHRESGGGGGYSGGGGAFNGGRPTGGGSLLNTAYAGYVSGSITAGGNGNGNGSDGFVTITTVLIPSFTISKVVDQTEISTTTTLDYTILVENTGDVDLTSPVFTDTLTQNGTGLTLTSGPTLVSGDTDSDNELDISEIWIYLASYNVTAGNISNGNDLVNTATFDAAELSAQQDTAITTITSPPSGGGNSGCHALSGSIHTHTDPLDGTISQGALSGIFETGWGFSGFSSVANTGGAQGTEFLFANASGTGEDFFFARYEVTPDPGSVVDQVVVCQSPYNNSSGNNEPNQLTITWPGGGNATIVDPVNQITSHANGSVISSGAVLTIVNSVLNNADQWGVVIDANDATTGFRVGTHSRGCPTPGGGFCTGSSGSSDTSGQRFNEWIAVNSTLAPVNSEISAVKTSVTNDGGDGQVDAGDTITYTYTISNMGGTQLFNVNPSELAVEFTGSGTLPVPVYASGGSDLDTGGTNNDLDIGETIVFTADYTLVQADIDAASLTNQAHVVASDSGGGFVADLSDESSTGSTADDPTITTIPSIPSVSITKSANDTTNVTFNQVVTYTYVVTNNGNQTLTNVSLADIHNGSGMAPIPGSESLTADNGMTGDSTDPGGVEWHLG